MSEREKLALSHPVSVILDKEPADFERQDFLKLLASRQLERISFHYLGLDGKMRELKIPVASRRQVETILAEGERVDGSSIYKGLVDMGVSDLYVVPVYKSAFSILLMIGAWISSAVILMPRAIQFLLLLIIFWPEPISYSGNIQV